MPQLPGDRKTPNGATRNATIDLILAFDELIILQAMSSLAARDPRFRVVSRVGDAWPADPLIELGVRDCVALIDGRCPPQNLTRVLQHRDVVGSVILTERHPGVNGTVRLPLGPRQSALPFGAPWVAVADALIRTYYADADGEGAGDDLEPLAWETERETLGSLTRRERQVMGLIADGMAVRDIAAALHLAESTVENHKARLMRKLGAKKSIEVVRFAFRVGVAMP